MTCTRSLSVLFASLLAACGTESDNDDSSTSIDETWESSCNDIPGSMDVEVPRSEAEAAVEADGTVAAGQCMSLCAEIGWGEITGCELLDAVEPAPATGTDGGDTSGGDTTGGEETTDGDGTAGDSESGGSEGGEGSTGTTGDESTGGTMGTTGMEDTVTVRCNYLEYCLGGRGHEALHARPRSLSRDALARWLASTAHSEAASVVAFEAMADELVAHGAPRSLVERARQAAADEVVHARMMTRLAHQQGAPVPAPRFDPIRIRNLESIALENAVEGCVRETWAALEAAYQARTAADPKLRRVMARIAADETRHAELSQDLDAWLRTQLPAETMARVDTARREAAGSLLDGMNGDRNASLCAQAGLPDAATARALAQGLRAQLWN